MLQWDAFENLPGAPEDNFEMLCRILIHQNYGRFGHFASLASQPGVEFHLKIETECSLGKPGQWFGWQCRWYELPSGRALGSTRRKKIVEAIRKTERALPNITDWVLWTKNFLTKGDQNWFYGLKTHMKLHLWAATEIEEHLSGDAEIFRSTYFGELILTPMLLAALHQQSVAPIKKRWEPNLHQITKVERVLRRMLGEPDSWGELLDLAQQLKTDEDLVVADSQDLHQAFADRLNELTELGTRCFETLTIARKYLEAGQFEPLLHLLQNASDEIPNEVKVLPRRLRNIRHRAALSVTNFLSDIRTVHRLLAQLIQTCSPRLLAVHGGAGYGKTELAAQLTASKEDRPSGILLHGRDLSAGRSLDELAHRVKIQGKPVPSIDALLAAVDSAGRRACRRLPIVIDGLNESEDPRDWKALLASIREILHQYPYVLFVCTLRSSFLEESLPEYTTQWEIPGFEEDTVEAVRRYFKFYRIIPGDALLYVKLLEHPLTLRIFCEVTNPQHEQDVSVENAPSSLTDLFDRYIDQTCKRVADLAPRSRRFYEMDIKSALNEIGKALWEEKTRDLELSTLRKRLGDDKYPWGENIVRALEQDGILLRTSEGVGSSTNISLIYDLLAGHLIADSMITMHGQTGFVEWLKNAETIIWLGDDYSDHHPLAKDIFQGLVGLLPRRLRGKQLWQFLEGDLQTQALRRVADLEGKYIDAESVKQLQMRVSESSEFAQYLFPRLMQTRGVLNHPLNAVFLDDVLRSMIVAERDLVWTEWIRRNQEEITDDLTRLKNKWQNTWKPSPADSLRARWISWLLTSTVRKLRDLTTNSLYWFGRGNPHALFELTLDALSINDQYISERLLAASYGVVMAHQTFDPDFATELSFFLNGLYDALVGANASHPTNHWISRLYVQGVITFASIYYPTNLPVPVVKNQSVSFAPGPKIDPIYKGNARLDEADYPLHLDFKNYTVGRLFTDRGNYDMDHSGYQAALAHIRGTIWDLGWREAKLSEVEQILMRYSNRTEREKTERYGKKYSWIGLYNYAGLLSDQGMLEENERFSLVDIDPSFPEHPERLPTPLPYWAQIGPVDDESWVQDTNIEVPDEILYQKVINGHPGPWVITYGYFQTAKQVPGREVFCFINALSILKSKASRLVKTFNSIEHPSRIGSLELPEDYYAFAGEIPWSPNFARWENGDILEQYCREVYLSRGISLQVGLLAHQYSWEGYHSSLNNAGGALVPPRTFSDMFDLRGVPQYFNQVQSNGSYAALSFSAPKGFEGHLLYLREDLLLRYMSGRQLIWLIWGERRLHFDYFYSPDWLTNIRRKGSDIWRLVRYGNEFSRLL